MSVDSNGWNPTTFPEIRAFIVNLWKAEYGVNTPTDPETPDGVIIDQLAMQLSLAFDTDTSLWFNSFFRSATGVSLDRILDLLNKEREPASPSVGTAVFYGAPATAVPVTTTVITSDTSANRFATDGATAIGAAGSSDAWVTRVQEPVSDGDNYDVQVDANPLLPTVAPALSTVTEIAVLMRDAINGQGFATAALAGLDDVGSALLVVEVVGGPGDVVTSVTGAALLDALEAVRSPVTATVTGALVAAAGTLQSLANPITGVIGVTNDEDATPGADAQNDDAFRASHSETLFANTARTDQGMRAAVARLPDVLENSVKSNRTFDPVDVDGRPIGSVENIVLRDDSIPVAESDPAVANAIASQICAGVEPYGLRSFGLGTTVDGEIIEVFATDVEKLYLWLDITITPGEGFPIGGDIPGAVAAAVANYFDKGIISTDAGVTTDQTAILVVGKDALRESAKTPINVVVGNASKLTVIETSATATPLGPPAFGPNDQVATNRQILLADAARITVTVL